MKPRKQQIDPIALKYRRNEAITAPEVRLIDSDGSPLGVVQLTKALELSHEQDLDLVEVAPNAKPPVCKIISWSKFKYDYSKKSKSNTAKTQMKELRFGALIGENDREHKTKRLKEFLLDKHLVKVTVKTPGRIKVEQSKTVINKVIEDIYEFGELEGPVKMEGNNVVAVIKPLKTKRVRTEDPLSDMLQPVQVV